MRLPTTIFTGQFASGSFMQLSEESICGEAAGGVGGARPKEKLPLSSSSLLTLFSY